MRLRSVSTSNLVSPTTSSDPPIYDDGKFLVRNDSDPTTTRLGVAALAVTMLAMGMLMLIGVRRGDA